MCARDASAFAIQEIWISCDNCWRWFHFTFVGLMVKPEKVKCEEIVLPHVVHCSTETHISYL